LTPRNIPGRIPGRPILLKFGRLFSLILTARIQKPAIILVALLFIGNPAMSAEIDFEAEKQNPEEGWEKC
jgi:hypothetical protein